MVNPKIYTGPVMELREARCRLTDLEEKLAEAERVLTEVSKVAHLLQPSLFADLMQILHPPKNDADITPPKEVT